MSNYTPYGVLERYLYAEEIGWSGFHAQRMLERLEAEGYRIVNDTENRRERAAEALQAAHPYLDEDYTAEWFRKIVDSVIDAYERQP